MAAGLGGALSPSPADADRRLLLGAAARRAVATSLVGVLLGIHLAQVGLRTSEIGVVAAAGLAREHASLAAPLVLGAGVKILYDLLLFAAFRPPEERTAFREVAGRPV